ncbi:hypothetical protein N9X36_02970 [Schleiferiaceae bacterium]|jgi:hypothetical protein|nr:hypothetical protein [Schleiferiaceae bacterium]MDB2539845.1 hypothetical protein [Schleiferiaceae bacterium]
MMRNLLKITTAAIVLTSTPIFAQTETESTDSYDDIDWSLYDDLGFEDESIKRYANAKIEGLSPAKLISFGYDFQGPYTITAASEGPAIVDQNGTAFPQKQDFAVNSTAGIRAGFNLPVVSQTNLVWQIGANYWNTSYNYAEAPTSADNPLHQTLSEHGLRTSGINTTVYKPLDEEQFILFQGSADMSGTYGTSLMPAKYLKYSAAVLWGKRPTEKKQWAVGVARTYRVGELNYIPVILYNKTSANNKWGTEALFPARVHVRRTINPRNMVFLGYELQGQSFRMYDNENLGFDIRDEDLEIRRGEIRVRAIYEFSLKNFIWMSVQAGYRINYRYDVDRLASGPDIYRAFGLIDGTPAYAQMNGLTNPFYVNVSVNLVSP